MPRPIEEVQSLSASMRYREAEQLLIPLLKGDPQNQELLNELAEVYLYTGRELEAFQLSERLDNSRGLRSRLADHFHAKAQLDPSDTNARTAYESLGIESTAGIRISACLIVKNEASNLPRCFASLQGIVDEIVVVDTGSTDNTVAVAREHGAILGSFDWIKDFSAARNHALTIASGDWILWIDADEEVTPESISVLREAIVRPQFGGFNAEIVNFTGENSDDSKYIHQALRLFRHHPDIQFSGRIHEQITPSLEALGLPWANLPGFTILHHGYRPSVMAERNKLGRAIDALEREVLEQPQNPFHWFNLANAYVISQRWPEGEHAAKMCALHAPEGYEYGPLNYQFLAHALQNQNKLVEGIKACDDADAKGYGGLFVEFERAAILVKVGNLTKALEAATKCCKAEWPTNSIGDRGIFDFKRWILKGQILALQGEFDEAISQFDHCASHPMAIYSRGATFEKAGRPLEALREFEKGFDTTDVAQLCLKSAARCSMTLGLPKQSAEYYERAWNLDRNDYESWMGWAQACETWGDLPSIVSAYEAYATNCEPTPQILNNWGRALELSGELDRALTCYTEAVQRDPNYANAYFNAGDLLYKLGQYHDAALLYQNGLKIEPNHAQGWFVLGNSLYQLGIKRGAIIGFEQALVIDPTFEAARNNLELATSGETE